MMLTALVLGLSSSLHCLGMCGPLALAMPKGRTTLAGVPLGPFLYNGGRILGYGILGLFIGLFGEAIALVGVQQVVSIGLGVFLLAFLYLGGENRMWQIPWMKSSLLRLKMKLSQFIHQTGDPAYVQLGVLNSLLPCGFVYVALAASLSLGGAVQGLTYMLLFGLGTLPAMLSLTLGKHFLPSSWHKQLKPALNSITFLMAFLLILRGLGLGIPWLSPVVEETGILLCH